MKKWYERASFTDPDYGTDVTDGVREVLRKETAENIIGEGNGELIRVVLHYVTRRGNVKTPVRYLVLQDCPEEDEKLRMIVSRVVDAEFTLRNARNPYRAVKDVRISDIERYAEVRMQTV